MSQFTPPTLDEIRSKRANLRAYLDGLTADMGLGTWPRLNWQPPADTPNRDLVLFLLSLFKFHYGKYCALGYTLGTLPLNIPVGGRDEDRLRDDN